MMPAQILSQRLVRHGLCIASFLTTQVSPTVPRLRLCTLMVQVSQNSAPVGSALRNTCTRFEGQYFFCKLLRNFSFTSCAAAKKAVLKTDTAPTYGPDDLCQVFDQTEKLIGQMKVRDAEDRARKESLRLVLMGKNPDGINCFRLISGRELAEEARQKRMERKADKVKEKEFRVKSNITDHDLEIKLRQAKESLNRGDHVKVVIRVHKRSADSDTDRLLTQLMKKVTSSVQDEAQIKQGIRNANELQLLLRPIVTTQADLEKK